MDNRRTIVALTLTIVLATIYISSLFTKPSPYSDENRLVDSLAYYPNSSTIHAAVLRNECGGYIDYSAALVNVVNDDLEAVMTFYEDEMSTYCSISQGFAESSFNCDIDWWIY